MFLSNSFFNSFLKVKTKKRTVFRFSFFMKFKNEQRASKIPSKNSLNKNIALNYLNFIFHIDVKTKSKNKTLNCDFQFTKNTKQHFVYRNFLQALGSLIHPLITGGSNNQCTTSKLFALEQNFYKQSECMGFQSFK